MNDKDLQKSAAPNQPPLDVVQKWLVRELARVLEISEEAIGINEPFSHFGLDSAKAVGLLNRLGEFLDRKIPVTLAWNYPTVEALTRYLCGLPDSAKELARAPHAVTWNQPVAIVGMACRFPGANNPEAFWEMLRAGRSAFHEITPDRWDIDAWYDSNPRKPGKMNGRMAGLLDRIDQFDPRFFGISPREAIQMDPQQRLAIELSWEALEDAGIRPDTLRGSRTGVFVGVVWHDYEILARTSGAEITAHSGTGQVFSIVANRISYALGLQGPSVALDTACSSSLVSVHLACRSLQAGDADLAIAGGVNLIILPETMVALSKFGGLSPTNKLYAFDARADGFVRGEGGGFVVLKPLDRALADGDPIYAVIRGTAVNNDGASNGLTAPNPQAQQAVIAEACVRAGVRPADMHYVEAHGTGTVLGDPIEAQALGAVMGRNRAPEKPLLVGSVKTNIGHLEGASGIAGLTKLILSIQHRQIPPSLNFETPNPHIDFEASRLRVVTDLEPWPDTGRPALGGVSAFGWGGTNCHIVVEELPRSTASLLPLSAPDFDSLKSNAQALRDFLKSNSAKSGLRDVCATAAARHASQPERLAVTARSLEELDAQVEGFLLGQKRPGVAVGRVRSAKPKLAFVFSPQGSQWLGMGRSLIAVEPVFRAKLAECDRALSKFADWSLLDELLAAPTESRLGRAEFVQPVLFSMQVALAALWEHWGVRPDFVAAHSLGEWAASYVAGALTLEDAMRVAVESSRAQAQASENCGMAVIEMPEEEVKKRIRECSNSVFIAGSNSPTSTLLSGDVTRLKSLVAGWKEEGLMCSFIDVDVAAHCPRMDPAASNLKAALNGLRATRVAVPFVSSISGNYLQGQEMSAAHWADHIRQPVRFTEVVERLAQDGCDVFLEISPHPLLSGAIQQTLAGSGFEGLALGSCRRGDDERGSLLNSLGALYSIGFSADWAAVTVGSNCDVSLPLSVFSDEANVPTARSAEMSWVIPLSGHTVEALRERARTMAHFLRTNRNVAVSDVAFTAAAHRTHLEHRLALVGSKREEFSSALEAFANGQEPGNVNVGRARANAAPKVAFICSGQGPQWWAMGRELLSTLPVFRREIARCADEMKQHVSWDLLKELTRDEMDSRLGETEIAQPALFAMQLALAAVWRSWGIAPQAVVGHSVGEVASAHLSGVLSFKDAVKVVCHRGSLMQRATGLGKMAAIELPEAQVARLLEAYHGRAAIAAANSPSSTVISGETAAVELVVAAAKAEGARGKLLPVNYAFHSPQMKPFGAEILEPLSGISTHSPTLPLYSTVTGALAAERDYDAAYWGRNICEPVRFAAAVEAMLASGINAFIELGPQPVLLGMVAQCAGDAADRMSLLPSLRQGQPERETLLSSLGSLFSSGASVNWNHVFAQSGRIVSLPNYPWQRKRYWLTAGAAVGDRSRSASPEVAADWYYEVAWEEKPRADDSAVGAASRQLPAPVELESRIKPSLDSLASDVRLVHSGQALGDIEKLAAQFATTALIKLGFEFLPGRRFTSESIREQLRVLPRHARLLARMLDMLEEDGLLKQVGGEFEVLAAPAPIAPAVLAQSMREQHGDYTTEFELLTRCGEKLPAVLRGEEDPLQLLFPIDASVSAERLYRDPPSARFYNRLVGQLTGAAVRDVQRGCTVRLLELGAGTGSTTTCVLEQLSGVPAEYCFTDISRSMVNEARARFEGNSTVRRFEVLNIEKPPDAQKFSDGGCDIVLAANVLHATTDLRATLKHVRQLLAPGGLLVLLETTAPRRWVDLIFGLTEGWWRFADLQLRPKHALLGADKWIELLRDCGFSAATAVGTEFSKGDLHEQTVLLAKADETLPAAGAHNKKQMAAAAKGRWLVFADAGGLAERVAQRLEQRGGECVLVHAGGQCEAPNPNRLTINLDEPQAYDRLVKDGEPWRGVLHAWSLDAAFDETTALANLERAEQLGCRSALWLVQALGKVGKSQSPKLWFLTRGAQPAWPQLNLNSIAQAALWGMGRTLAIEHPELWGGLIDIAPDGDPDSLAGRVAPELYSPDGEDQVAVSENLRLIPRLVAASPPSPTPMAVKPDVSYLITGGLGGLGPRIARWLVKKGARHLILCGRRDLPERNNWGTLDSSHEGFERVKAILELEKEGATVCYERMDVADRGQMEAMFERLRNASVPLRGIIHAAADIKFCPLKEMSADALHATLRAKVQGAWLLHELSRELPLDFFVLFSSAASLFGGSRLGHYAASNQFLDFLAHWRRAAGLHALSVNWGAWEEIRLLGEDQDEVGRFGLKPMPAERALEAMSFLVAGGVAQRMVAEVDRELLRQAYETRGRQRFFERLSTRRDSDKAPETTGSGWSEVLNEAAPEDRRELLCGLIVGETRRVLGLDAADQINPDRGLFEMGMDSLMSVQLKGRLEKATGHSLPATLTFTYPTVEALTDYLLGQVLKLSTASLTDNTSRTEDAMSETPTEDLTGLSDEEVKSMLSEELSSLSQESND